MMKKIAFLGLLIPLICVSNAQAEEPTFEKKIPRDIVNADTSYLTLTYENDLLGSGTDAHYTNGIRLTYFDSTRKASNFMAAIKDILPFMKINETSAIYYSLGQNLYTPEDITDPTLNPNDRPYAGFLYGSIGASTFLDNHVDEIEFTLGVVGPAALGKQTQKTVHKAINSPDPQGWDHQLKNEPALNITYQRVWPEVLKADIDPFYVRVNPHAGFSLGNVYTYGAAGSTIQFLPKKYRWQAPPQRIRPAIPGSGQFYIPDNEFAWALFAGAEVRAVGHNIFLDGNTFRDSPSVDKEHLVADVNAGFSVTYGAIQTAYTVNWRSREFDGQKDPSVFGAINLSYRY